MYRRFAAALALLTVSATGAKADPGVAVGELVVTAQRREQIVLDVPIALTAYDSETLTRLRVRTMHDLATFTPGLLVQDKSPLDSRFVLRGIGSDDGSSYQEARVSVFQDGAPMAKSRGAYVELFDLDRVEVARGPQTTLYGRSALIGAINLIQRKAEPGRSEASLRAEAGTYGARLVDAAGDIPLGQHVALRAAGRYRHRDGAIDNLLGGADFGGFDVGAARLALTWRPSDSFRGDILINHQTDDGTGQPLKSRTFNPSDPATGIRLGDTNPNHGAALASPPGFAGGDLGYERDITSLTAIAAWRGPAGASLNLTSSYRRFESQQTLDYDGFGFALLTVGDDVEGEQQSHDLRLNYEPGPDLTFIGGLSLYKESGRQETPLQMDERLILALVTGALDRRSPDLRPLSAYTSPTLQAQLLQGVVGAAGGTLTTAQALAIANNLSASHTEIYTDFAKNQAADLYGDLTWRPSARWEVSAGIRFSYAEKESAISATLDSRSVLAGVIGAVRQAPASRAALLGALATPGAATRPTSAAFPVPMFGLRVQPTSGNGSVQGEELIDKGAAWRLTARYALTPQANIYATYARGRRPQVLAPNTPSAPGGSARFEKVAAETVDSFELGLKWRAPAHGLAVDAAVYAYDYAHFQTIIQQGAQFITADAGQAQSLGFEMQGQWELTAQTSAFINYAASRARFEEGLYQGNHLALSPDHSLTIGVNFTADAPGGAIAFTPTYTYRSKVFFTDDNGDPALAANLFVAPLDFQASQGGYGLLDLRLTYLPSKGPWSAGLFVTNALDTSYVKEAGNGGEAFGLPTYIAGNPRMVGVSLSWAR